MKRDIIIKYAEKNGFKLPKKIKTQKTIHEKDKLPYNIKVSVKLTKNDINVHRAITRQGNDLGEWWITYPHSLLTHRVADRELQKYIRKCKLKRILKFRIKL